MDGSLEALRRLDKSPQDRTPEILARMRQLYAAEVTQSDEGFGAFLGGLRSLGLDDRTVVALTADHGEEFYEHGQRDHGRTVYQEVLRVPLIVRDPYRGREGRRDTVPRALVDLTTMILERAGAEPLPGSWGVSLETARRPDFPFVFSEQIQRGSLAALRLGRYKIIRDRTEGRDWIYDLEADPTEQKPLPPGGEAAKGVSRALDRADELIAQARPYLGQKVDEEEIPEADLEALRALGYIE
jgi:arylsulfatase A-like enzyme